MAWSDAARAAAREARRRRLSQRLQPGQIVRYARPGPGERGFRFKVLEAHYPRFAGEVARVHAQVLGWQSGRIVPVETVSPSELRPVRPADDVLRRSSAARLRVHVSAAAARGQLFGIPGKFYRKGKP